jgi:RNA polymerase sigma-70 factor (ECF subfamily)
MSSAEDAADCMSETLLVLWQRRDGIPATTEDCRRYAFGIAARIVLAEHRGVSQRAKLISRIIANYEPATVDAYPRDSDPALAEALTRLTPRDRELILLVAWEGFGVAEAGAVLGLKADAARARYSRARARLRTALSG